MNIAEQQIEAYIDSHPEPKQSEMRGLHQLTLQIMPSGKLWFNDGKNGDGKVVTNPNIGYGSYIINYSDGTSREFYRIGLSGNKTGISIYILGLEDKTYLTKTFGERIGKASVTGYCIKFKKLADVNVDVLQEAIRHGLGLL